MGQLQLRGRWTEQNRAALQELLRRDYRIPPIAVFDWDQTCIQGDIANAVFHELCRGLAFAFESPEFQAWVEELPVPTRILECFELFAAKSNRETRAALRFELERTRMALHESEDDNQAWAWDSGAFVTWKPYAVREYTRRVVAKELAQPLAAERLEREETLEWGRGLRTRPEMHELMTALRGAGWRVYIISASPQWVVEAFAERYYVPPQNVIGMRRAIVDGRITAALEPPCSWGDGKLDAYQMFVTRDQPPNFVAGDGVGDWTLLAWATDCALLVEPNLPALRDFGEWRKSLGENWLFQRF